MGLSPPSCLRIFESLVGLPAPDWSRISGGLEPCVYSRQPVLFSDTAARVDHDRKGVLFALSAQDVEALPVKKSKSGVVSLPLRRFENKRDLHPLILHQQNINRSRRRHARMTGRQEPSDLELRDALVKRVASLEGQLDKRFNRVGLPGKGARDLDVEKRFNRGGLTGTSGRVNVVTDPISLRRKNRNGKNRGAAAAAAAAADDCPTTTAASDVASSSTVVSSTATASAAEESASASAGAANTTTSADADDSVTVSNEPDVDNSVRLDIESIDIGYLSPVQLGTPPREFLLLMDSGSADTWVGGENCQSEDGGDCGDHEFLGPQSSSSFQQSNRQFQVTYGTGAVAGTIIADNLNVGGLALDAHIFGVADVESVEFSRDTTSFDGLMGLAQSILSNQGTLTPPEAMVQAGLIDEAITSYKIPRLADGLLDGVVTFGGLDETKFDAATLTIIDNINTQGFWEAGMDAITVDGQDTRLAGRSAIIDTGTTLIIAPDEDALAIHQLIDGAATDGQGGFTVPCTTTASIALTFGGTEFTIDPRDIAFTPLDPNDPTGDCISGISSGQIGDATQWLIGDVFLKNAYFSHNVNQNTLSLAKLV